MTTRLVPGGRVVLSVKPQRLDRVMAGLKGKIKSERWCCRLSPERPSR